jgi:hypothetical protein
VDNFVDSCYPSTSEACKIKAFTGMPGKRAQENSFHNQQLTSAIGFVAGAAKAAVFFRAATQVLCISQDTASAQKKLGLRELPDDWCFA